MRIAPLVPCAIILLLLAGCTGSSSAREDLPDVDVGTEGLTLEFLKNSPPEEVFAESNFPVILEVANKGAYSIEGNQRVLLSLGVERDYTSRVELQTSSRVLAGESDNEARFPLEGKSIANPRGGEEVVSYTVTAGRIDPQSERHLSTVIASVCYPYETELSANVCVDADPNNIRQAEKSCQAADLSLSGGQGGPVTITRVEVRMLPKNTGRVSPEFLLHVENKGRGEVTRLGSYTEFCRDRGSAVNYRDLNAILVEAFLSGVELECSTRHDDLDGEYIRLLDKKDVVRCVLEEGIPDNRDAYTAPLNVRLTYGYTQSVSEDYLILKS